MWKHSNLIVYSNNSSIQNSMDILLNSIVSRLYVLSSGASYIYCVTVINYNYAVIRLKLKLNFTGVFSSVISLDI